MTTARDLALVALGLPPDRLVEQGDLSLALAGAEAVDLVQRGALTLDGDRMMPGPRPATGDRLLDQAAAALVRQEPHETVEDWLWRRGNGLTEAYVDELDRAGFLVHPQGHGFRARFAPTMPADSPERRRAEERRASGEPVLAALTDVLRIGHAPLDTGESLAGDAAALLAAVGDAVAQLEAVRLRRGVEDAAFDNVWRG
ncbi:MULTISPECIES: GPP34 family phosphoprotein [Streptomyces]|uniref:GPP34 family phosphoprotein n=1 Tax=Streptomyces TaxID=1883 RepID=UPI0023DD02F8|nr:GPP34 family phosphoprotein [Streptomyces sp. FXJ1.172]WEP00860.1 GPP34 family phosphoprotein [Streptomyces sp. FXJ1.172]